jgi:hypothetical protein
MCFGVRGAPRLYNGLFVDNRREVVTNAQRVGLKPIDRFAPLGGTPRLQTISLNTIDTGSLLVPASASALSRANGAAFTGSLGQDPRILVKTT